MANISSNNLTSLYGGGKDTVITTTVVPNVAGTIPSKNLTTLYSGAGAPVTATTSYGNANVERFLNSGTDGGNTIQNIVATGNITGDYYFGNGYYLTGIDTSNANTANYANYANFAGNAFSVNVANVVGIGNIATLNLDGNVSNVLHGDGTFGPESGNLSANFALYAGNVTVNSQPNITSLGTLTGLNVNGVSNLGPVSNVIITGGSANYALITDGNGVLSWGQVANASNAANANYANFAGTAFSVNVANVVGIGNIAVLNLDGNSGNILYGNGVFATVPNTATANFANYAGNVTVNSQPNITSVGTLVSLDVTGNITSGNANLGNLAIANFFSGDGGLLSNINAANVTGEIPTRLSVKNTSGGTLTKGTPVYVTGTVGATTVVEVSPSRADTASTMGCVGLLEQDLVNNATGYAVSVGTLLNVNTSTYAVGNQLYVGITGGLTNTRPTDGNIVQSVGIVGRVNSSTGSIEVNIWNINGLPNLNNGNIWVGNSSNGYPVQAVLSTANVGNSNYANYAGNLINGTSNVSIPVANGNIVFSPNGIANAVNIQTTGQMNLMPSTSALNAIVINSIGTSVANDSSRISSFRYRGTMASPLSVQPGDTTMRFLTLGHNGTALQTSSVASIRAQVDTSYTANGANIPIGWQVQVNDTNGGTNNETKNHNFYSNGNISFANSLVVNNNITSTNGNLVISTGNITATLGTFYGNGAGLTNLPAGNLSGNLSNLVVANANTELPIYQIQPTHNLLVGNTSNTILSPYAYKLTQDYGNGQNDGNLSMPGNESYIKYRGNSTSPTSASANDRIQKVSSYGYNGTANTLAVVIDSRITNVNANSNAVFSGGSYNITTGNPLGDTGNANSSSAYNSYVFDQWGRILVTQGTAPTGVTNGVLVLNTYGGSPGPNNSTSAGIVFNRYRGNRDSNLSLQPNDQTGRIIFIGANNSNSVFNTRVAQLAAYVDGSYVANTANVPQGMSITVCDNTTSYTQNFYANGNVGFVNSITGSNITVTANVQGANVRSTSLLRGLGNTTLGDPSNIAAATHVLNGNTNLVGNVFVGGGLANGSLLVMQYGNNGIQVLDGNILVQNANGNGGYLTGTFVRAYNNLVLQELGSGPNISMYAANGTISTIGSVFVGNAGASPSQVQVTGDKSIYSGIVLKNGQYTVTSDNVNPFTGFTPLGFGSYNNSNSSIPPNRFFRARGTEASPAPVQTNDQLSATSYGVYADSGNTYLDTFYNYVTVTGNDNAGNVTADYELRAFNTGSNIRLNASNIYSNGNIITSGSVNASGTINSNSYITASNYMQSNSITANSTATVGQGGVPARLYLNGDKTANSGIVVTDAQFNVTLNEVSPSGFSPFFFSTYSSANTQIAPVYYYRARGNSFANAAAVASNDVVSSQTSAVYADSGNAFISVAQQTVTVQSNDGAGNVAVDMRFKTLNSGSTITFDSVNSFANIFTANYLKGDGSNITNINGANISGQVANALVAGTVYTNAQPNITSVGTLTGLSVSGNANIGNLQLVKFEETVIAGGTVSGTLTPNSSAGTIYNYTLNGNITINSLGNAVAGTSMTLILTQDGTGNRILSSTMKFASGLKTLSTAANATDILSVFYDGTTYYATLSRGFV